VSGQATISKRQNRHMCSYDNLI